MGEQRLWPFVSTPGAVEARASRAGTLAHGTKHVLSRKKWSETATEIYLSVAVTIWRGARADPDWCGDSSPSGGPWGVQGVFFRDTCRRKLGDAHVSGWVANRDDGAVEAVFEGEPSEVEAMVDWARRGPDQAYVIKLEVTEEKPRGELGFSVR